MAEAAEDLLSSEITFLEISQATMELSLLGVTACLVPELKGSPTPSPRILPQGT